jgi:hypothetical protein
MSGAAVLGSSGDTWNILEGNPGTSATVVSGLLDSTGSSSGVSLSYLDFGGDGGFGFADGGSGDPASLFDGIAQGDNLGSGSSVAQLQFVFSGLPASTPIDVVAYGSRGGGVGTHFFQTIGGSIDGSTSGTTTSIANGAGDAYTSFQLMTDVSGSFTLYTNFNSGSSASGPVNGFQLSYTSAVPEPSTYAVLLGSLVLGAMVYRRRKQA